MGIANEEYAKAVNRASELFVLYVVKKFVFETWCYRKFTLAGLGGTQGDAVRNGCRSDCRPS